MYSEVRVHPFCPCFYGWLFRVDYSGLIIHGSFLIPLFMISIVGLGSHNHKIPESTMSIECCLFLDQSDCRPASVSLLILRRVEFVDSAYMFPLDTDFIKGKVVLLYSYPGFSFPDLTFRELRLLVPNLNHFFSFLFRCPLSVSKFLPLHVPNGLAAVVVGLA